MMSHLGHARRVVCTKVLLTWEPPHVELIADVQMELRQELASQDVGGLVGGDASDELAPWRVADSSAGHHPARDEDPDKVGIKQQAAQPPPEVMDRPYEADYAQKFSRRGAGARNLCWKGGHLRNAPLGIAADRVGRGARPATEESLDQARAVQSGANVCPLPSSAGIAVNVAVRCSLEGTRLDRLDIDPRSTLDAPCGLPR